MGFFKKIGKLAKKRLNFKHLSKMMNPLNVLNPLHGIKQLKGDFKDVKGLFQSDDVPQYTPKQIHEYQQKFIKNLQIAQNRNKTRR
jgi:hypothetical protein